LNCIECGRSNQSDAKFCEGCGTKLLQESSLEPRVSTSNEEVAAASSGSTYHTTSGNSQQYIEKGKAVLKLYFSYFLTLLKSPVLVAGKIGRSELTNGIITIALFALIIPLMTYLGLRGVLEDSLLSVEISFSSFVIKPFFTLVILLTLVGVIIFGTTKLGKTSASFLDILARFGAFLVVPTGLLLIALLLSLFGSNYFILFLILGLMSFSFIIPLIIYSLLREEPNGLDVFYCTFLTYIGIIILFTILGEQAFQGIKGMISSFNPLGY
jgi:hypothetical protein